MYWLFHIVSEAVSLMVTCFSHTRFVTWNTILRKRLADMGLYHKAMSQSCRYSYCVGPKKKKKKKIVSDTILKYYI